MMNFISDKKGVVAVMFGMMFPVLIATMGLGYDLAQGYLARARLTQALDASGLAVAGTTGTAAELEARFNAFMNVNYPDDKLGTVTDLNFTKNGNDITVDGVASIETSFMRWFGQDTIDVYAKTVIHREVQGVEVALVLDNTGSMAGTKLQNLKEASTTMIDMLEEAAEGSVDENAVRIGIVPYTMTVNVGTAYANAAWLDRAGTSTISKSLFNGATVNRMNLYTSLNLNWGGCVEQRAAPYDVTEAPPITSNVNTLYTPYFAVDEPDSSNSTYGGPYYNNYRGDNTSSTNWLTRQSRTTKYNGNPTSTGTTSFGYQYGPNAGCGIQPMMRLTQDYDALRTRINNMTAIGETVILTGMMWGWHLLSPNAPFADGVAYDNTRYKKIIILMTDGQNSIANSGNNNQSYYSGMGYIWQNRYGITSGSSTQRRTALDNKLSTACTNAKKAGIIIYTVRLETSGDNTVMRKCATYDDYFYDVDDSEDLEDAFANIANSIQNLRITQ